MVALTWQGLRVFQKTVKNKYVVDIKIVLQQQRNSAKLPKCVPEIVTSQGHKMVALLWSTTAAPSPKD